MSVATLQKIQDNFSAAVGAAMVIVGPDGEPVTEPSGFTSFCAAIRSRPGWRERCCHCDSVGGRTALSNGEPCIYKCHCGLVDFAAPITICGEYLGAVICGQMNLVEDGSAPKFMDLSELFPTEEAWRRDDELLRMFREIGTISYDKLRAAAYSLYYISSYIVEESYRNSVSEELYRNKLRLMEESKRRAELEGSLREAELRALSYQVNPHFLFNVLNTIGRLALIEGAEETETTVQAFADMMRYILRKSGAPLVPLSSEIEHVENYLYLLALRLGDRFDFEIVAGEGTGAVLCPFMVLQPIVENCINYAIEPRESGGVIRIETRREGDDVLVDIIDNGEGISPERKAAALAGNAGGDERKSIGISNVDSRMRHYFGEDHGLEIVSPHEDGRGTLVRLRIPVDFDPAAIPLPL
ncbi:PocR ligand-binding domain-containing protein [Salipiger bermudensis]|uniref:sensor histidine kinase n=1 Tax=Salipiger bermudensis TaxID=344736 RepID=UPI001C992A89|nr:PocR ligand-binding domain-containing protein [Salipiger bermudensis]MBY6003017.1 PocR ligand-binding domain-containing protein [Salipiger bermudensis]